MTREQRYDFFDLPKVSRTEEGFIQGEAVVTRAGVFPYQNTDGTMRYELRHPEDVFEQESLNSLKLKPVTLDHPAMLVTKDNAAGLSVGSMGENWRIDYPNIIASLSINTKEAISSVDAGKNELSLGYSVEVVDEAGEYEGVAYTHRQRNIRYNHLAIVDQARAGEEAVLNLDGFFNRELSNQTHREDKKMSEKQQVNVVVRGITYRADEEVKVALEEEQEKKQDLEEELSSEAEAKKALEEKISELTAQLDEAKQQLDSLGAEKEDSDNDEENKDNEGDVDQAVEEKLAVIEAVEELVNMDRRTDAFKKEFSGKTAKQMKRRALEMMKVNLDGKDHVYVAARFDAACEYRQKPIHRQFTESAGQRKDGFDRQQQTGVDVMKQAFNNHNAKNK